MFYQGDTLSDFYVIIRGSVKIEATSKELGNVDNVVIKVCYDGE